MKYFCALLAFLWAAAASAQPSPVPSPWNYGPSLSIFYNNGGVVLGNATGGTQGVGTINVHGGFYVDGTPVGGAFGSQTANKVFASPNGGSGTPAFRAIVMGDLPANLAVSGTLGVTGATTLVNASLSGTLSVTGATTLGALAASGAVTGAGFTALFASPPCYGCTAPGAVSATTLSTTGLATIKSMTTTQAPSITIAPTGNPATTLTSRNLQATSASSTTVEFLSSIGFTMNTGSVGAYVNSDGKVAQYVGAKLQSGAKAGWAVNELMELDATLNANFFASITRESDYNNLSTNDFHTTYGAVGALTQYVGNELITGAGTNQADFAIAIGGINTNTSLGMYNRGIMFLNGLGATQADIQSEDASKTVLFDFGAHQRGLHLTGAYSVAAIQITPAGSAPFAIVPTGTYSSAVIDDGSTSPNGINLHGTYSNGAIIIGSGSKICMNGAASCHSWNGTATAFDNPILTVASTTTIAGLNLPQGAAPTSPVNGDIWMTTAGLFYRHNGITVGPL